MTPLEGFWYVVAFIAAIGVGTAIAIAAVLFVVKLCDELL